jgi:hypothetical protein
MKGDTMNDYSDDLSNSEEDYWEQQQADQELAKIEKVSLRRQAKQTQADQQRVQNDAFQEGLKEYGLSPEEFQQILNNDPAGATQEFEEGIKRYIGKVAKRTRNARGQFVASGAPAGNRSGKWA